MISGYGFLTTTCKMLQPGNKPDMITAVVADQASLALMVLSLSMAMPEMQDLTCRFLIQLEPGSPLDHVSLSNLHASSRRWDLVSELKLNKGSPLPEDLHQLNGSFQS
ncbi:hypothetical protein DKX38_013269 [Salix brachista]|uniref:Uncharacterized protein n=1 Tax=Salix brachista TaxID=2182728 RepID=A0A5N5LQW2_9ROSI|nr:hypothetical protein DKX38_013269 [Salix brachista]